MKDKIKVLAIVVMLGSVLALAGIAQGFPNEPQGFRGLKFATELKDLSDMTLVKEKNLSGKRLSVYQRKADRLQMGKAELDKINYGFFDERFYLVTAVAYGRSDYKSLKEVLTQRYGQPSRSISPIDRDHWVGEEVEVILDYKAWTKQSVVIFMYKPILMEIQAIQGK